MEENKTEWHISELYSKSWQIIKKNKVLWLFGIAASSGSLFFRFNLSSLNDLFKEQDPVNTSSKLTQVLGDSTNAVALRLEEVAATVPLWLYVLLGIGILLFVLLSIVLGIIYQAWVEGAMIAGINSASAGNKPTISENSNIAFPAIRGLIWINLVPGLIFAISSALVFAVLFVAIVLLPSLTKIIPAVLIIVAIFVWVHYWIRITLAQVWASREVVLDRQTADKSFKHSFKIVKKTYWRMVALALVNTLVLLFGIGIVLLPVILFLVIFIIALAILKSNPSLIGLLVVFGGILLIPYMVGCKILLGIFNSFKASVWTLAYNQSRGESNE